jgi:hypothetical protein
LPASPAQLIRSVSLAGAASTYTINLNEVGTPFANDRAYTLEVQMIDTRDNDFVGPENANILSRSRAYFDFELPSSPTTTEPVPIPSGGTVTTGTAGGATTAEQPTAASITVPEAAVVSISLTPGPEDTDVPSDSLAFYKISIPDPADPSTPLYFGVGTRWYDCYEKIGGDDDDDDGDKSSRESKGQYTGDGRKYDKDRYRLKGSCPLIVNTLRIDKSRIGSGRGTMPDANLILKQKLYYKPEQPTERAPENPPVYKQLYSCRITSGPYPGEPCVLYAKVYEQSSLPTSVANPQEYLGDYEALILTNENGRIYLR